MAQNQEFVDRVAEILANSERYPWKTAGYLSRKLRQDGLRISGPALEQALLNHAKNKNRKVRYSYYPARKTLDLLWGHVDVVKEASELPDPHLEADFEDFEPCAIPENHPWCFFSHSFRDLDQVRLIYDELLQRGYGVWLAEAEIFKGYMIVEAVQEGLRKADRFIFYASRNSLKSRWVLKEILQFFRMGGKKITVIVDGRDDAMCAFWADWVEHKWSRPVEELLDELITDAPNDPAATGLENLLIDGLGSLPRSQRTVVLYPFPDEKAGGPFYTFDEKFPRLTEI